MQEKVHFTPPKIKIFQGKPPPTSWFNENIVRFYQVKNAQEFLSDVVPYLQQMASEKLAKSKQEGKLLLEFSYVPEEEGSAEDITNAVTYNTLQNHVGTQIQYLIRLTNIIKAGNPEAARDLDQSLNELHEMVKAFPTLSENQLNTLSSLMAKLNEMVKKTPLSTQKSFWDEELKMLKKMITTNKSAIMRCDEEVSYTQNQLQEMQKFKTEISSLFNLLTGGQTKEGLSQLVVLLQHYKNLPKHLKKALKTTLSKAAKMRSKKGTTLPELLATETLNRYIKQVPTLQQMIEYIEEQTKQPPFDTLSPPFMADVLAMMHQNVDNPDFPASPTTLGPNHDQADEVSHAINTFEFDPSSVKDTSEAINAYFTEQERQCQNRMNGMQQASQHMKSAGDNLGQSAASSVGKAVSSGGSLADDFSNAILHHYMPNQEQALLEMAEILMFDNLGASMGNDLLQYMDNFLGASNTFSLNQWLQGQDEGDGKYKGSATQAKNNISAEKNQAYQDYKSDEKAIEKIKSELKSIEQNSQLTTAQKNQLESQLKGIKKDLEASKGQVKALYKLLSHLHVEKTDSKHFKITDSKDKDWAKKLPDYENIAANGATAAQAKKYGFKEGGGLTNIYQETKAFQGNYSGLAQNQQMQLQMTMTEIQQEWTVVSTALQLLNQMYMTIAQGIYK